MYWNIGLALLIGGIAGGMAALGGHLASTKAWHKRVFWGGALVVWILIALQTYRAEKTQGDLQSQLNTIQRNTEKPQPAPIVNVPAPVINIPAPQPPHAHVGWVPPFQQSPANFVPFHKGELVAMNFGFKNESDSPVVDPSGTAILKLVPISELEVVFKKYRKQIKNKRVSGVLNARSTTVLWHTYSIDEPLTEEQVKALNERQLMLCGIGSAWWDDASGKYKTNLCMCYLVGDSDWHYLDENNKERLR